MCEAFGTPPWQAEHVPGRWVDVCHAYLVWKSEEEQKAIDEAKRGGAGKKGDKLPPPAEHKRPSSRSR